jgi:hypothetical protein
MHGLFAAADARHLFGKICSEGQMVFMSTGQFLYLVFSSDYSNNYKGFQLAYKLVMPEKFVEPTTGRKSLLFG